MRNASTGRGPVNIVVPVYNVADLLSRCVDSLLAQTYEDVRIILVDDGSTDDCPQYATDTQNKTRASSVSTGRTAGSQLPVTRESTTCSQSKSPRADDT